MVTNRLQTLFNRAKAIYREEGLLATIKRIFNFAVSLILSAISYENSEFHVNRRVLGVEDEADDLPKISNVTHRIVETEAQLDELQNEEFDLSLLDIDKPRNRLQKGAIVSLVFVGNELGHKTWTALTEEAKNIINPYPYKVDFENGEVCSGNAWTNPKYRRQGLQSYSTHKKEQYLIGKGVVRNITIRYTTNVASVGFSNKKGNRIISKARYVRIFGLQFWREKPVKQNDEEG